MLAEVEELARLLQERNVIDGKISALINRPAILGHAGEWLASKVFKIELARGATQPGYDGRFTAATEALAGRTVNVKWYPKRESILDMNRAPDLDYYLVLTGPASAAAASNGTGRPWHVDNVYLFDAQSLLRNREAAGVKIGEATSVPQAMWEDAEVFPVNRSAVLRLTADQKEMLSLFSTR